MLNVLCFLVCVGKQLMCTNYLIEQPISCCPSATGVLSNSKGEPVPMPKVICMHEEDVGLLWKHVEYRTGGFCLTHIHTSCASDYHALALHDFPCINSLSTHLSDLMCIAGHNESRRSR